MANKNFVSVVVVMILGIAGGIYYLNNAGLQNQLAANEDISLNTSVQEQKALSDPAADEIRFILNPVELSRSNQKGIARIGEKQGKIVVTLAVDSSSDVPQPAHIHTGACPTPGKIVYPLNDVIKGRSETMLDISLDELKSQIPLVINILKSTNEKHIYTSCGDIIQ